MKSVQDSSRSEATPTEAQLIDAARDGDAESFKAIVRMLESRVAATAIGMLGMCPEAEDAGQEAFIRLHKALTGFRGESSLATYVTRIVVNLCLKQRGQRKRRSEVFVRLGADSPDIADPRALVDRHEQRDLVNWALGQVNSKDRAVLVLRLMQKCSTRETAEILDVPEGTVTSRLARAQQKLRAILESQPGQKP